MLILDSVLILAAFLIALGIHDAGAQEGATAITLFLYPVGLTVFGAILSLTLELAATPLNNFETGSVDLTGIYAKALAGASHTLAHAFNTHFAYSIYVIFGFCCFTLVIVSRVILLPFIVALYHQAFGRKRILIYGAGTTGTQLASALRHDRKIEAVAFVDDAKALQGIKLAGLRVYQTHRLSKTIAEQHIDQCCSRTANTPPCSANPD